MGVLFRLYRIGQADLLPQARVDCREDRVALDVGVDLGEHELIGETDCEGVDLATADDGDAA